MDVNLSYAVSNEDLVGVLRTIMLFLESINFKTTSTVLQSECSSKGYLQVVSAPAKLVVVHSSSVQCRTSHQGNQTEFPIENDKSYELESSVHDMTNPENNSNPTSFHMYYKNGNNDSSNNNMFDKYSTRVVVSDNIYLQKGFSASSCLDTAAAKNQYTVEKPKESHNMNSNKQNKNLEFRRCPNTIESEIPSKISSKNFSKNSSSEVLNQRGKNLRKTHSNPALKTNSETTKLDDTNSDGEKTNDSRRSSTTLVNSTTDCQELRKRFRQLQNEHRKLMGVTTELTAALQTHILGQSENLNSMLNNCRNIYPDLFKSVHNQNSNNFENILTKHSSPGDSTISNELFEEDLSDKALSNQTMQQNSSSPSIAYAEKLSMISNQTDVVRESDDHRLQNASRPRRNQDCDNTSHGSSPSNKTIRNRGNILQNSSPRRRSRDSGKVSQGSLPSSKTIRNSDNIILKSSSPERKSQNDDDISQGSLPSRKTIRNSDNIILESSSPARKSQNGDDISQDSLPSGKTIRNSDNIILESSSPTRKSQNGDDISQGSLPSRKTIRNSDNIILESSSPARKSQNGDDISQRSLTSRKTIRNSDNILLYSSSPGKSKDSENISQESVLSTKSILVNNNILQNTPPRENQKSNNKSRKSSPSSTSTVRNSNRVDVPLLSKSVKYNVTNEENQETGVFVEIKNSVGNSSYSTTILTPKLKRPHSSSIILVTTTDEPQSTESKILLRQLSSKSLDESLLANNSKPNQSSDSSCEVFASSICETTADDTDAEVIMAHTTSQIPEIKNAEQQTSYIDTMNQELYQENPEIFVTTEHLEKLQRECKCKLADESNYSSPRNKYFDLDFRKLKKDMLNGDDNLKLGLIQALRWRITQSDRETRDQVISSYIRHDLLGLHSSPNACGQSTTEIYYCPNKETPHPLQEGMARLVNTFASLTLGRDYLCQDDDLLISLLAPLVIGTHYSRVNIDDVARDMLMATLQKLSIRNRQRIRMISAGLVEYLVTFLATKHTTISEYCMEYTTALLMNLCLHREARELLHSSATDVVSLLADLLNTKHRSCMPYVNGAMYSLLGDPYINKEAHRLNLAKLIEYHIKRTDGEMRRQLEFILKLHLKGDGQSDCGCDPNLEPENEVDLLEPELDSRDSTEVKLAGEELLKNYRLLFSAYGAQVNASHLKCLCRPVTPRVQSNEQLIAVSDNFEDDKMIQVSQHDIIQETNFQVEKEMPHVYAKRRCTCFAETSTQSDNPNKVDTNYRSHTPQLCTCADTTSTNENNFSNLNKTSPIKTKRGNSLSEPITGFKNDTKNPIQKAPLSEKSSRSNSPDMSYSEETKQFYHTPSAKTGIFEPQKQKKLHRVAPSFTRTIPLPQNTHPLPSMCENPFCSHPYSKSMPVTPKENSSARNPPYALDYPIGFTTCYRENFTNQMDNLSATDGPNTNCNSCSNNNKRSRFRCNCYNVIKGYIDQAPQDNINSNKNEHSTFDQQNTDRSFVLPVQNVCCNCHNANNVSTRGSTAHNLNDTTINRGKDVLVNFSYEELLNAVRTDVDHVCPNPGVECQCYDVVFQSRPKILRTPP